MKTSRLVTRLLAVVLIMLIGGGAVFIVDFSNPMPASPVALAAMQSTGTVTVTDAGDQIVFIPKTPPTAGFIFYPGARVAPAAYAARLKPVAEKGYAVFIVKFPLNLAMLGTQRAAGIIAAHPEIKTWAMGGHSLGGAFAAAFLAGRSDVHGIILYGSYPAGDLSKRTDLVAVSIYGTQDGLATVEKVDKAKPTMPPQTQYVPIEGGIHSFFGDYGIQPGDGNPTISRADAAQQIANATIAAMDEIAAKSR